MQHQQQHMLTCWHLRQQLQHKLRAAAMLLAC
jgi:hypothetical protein